MTCIFAYGKYAFSKLLFYFFIIKIEKNIDLKIKKF